MHPAAPAWQAMLSRAWRINRRSLTTSPGPPEPPAPQPDPIPPMLNEARETRYLHPGGGPPRARLTGPQRRRLAKRDPSRKIRPALDPAGQPPPAAARTRRLRAGR